MLFITFAVLIQISLSPTTLAYLHSVNRLNDNVTVVNTKAVHFNGVSYVMQIGKALSYRLAEETCRKNFPKVMHLASVQTDKEWSVLSKQFGQKNAVNIWLGGEIRRQSIGSQFSLYWIDHRPFLYHRFSKLEQNKWLKRFSNGQTGCTIGDLFVNGDGNWTTELAPCNEPRAFICKDPKKASKRVFHKHIKSLFSLPVSHILSRLTSIGFLDKLLLDAMKQRNVKESNKQQSTATAVVLTKQHKVENATTHFSNINSSSVLFSTNTMPTYTQIVKDTRQLKITESTLPTTSTINNEIPGNTQLINTLETKTNRFSESPTEVPVTPQTKLEEVKKRLVRSVIDKMIAPEDSVPDIWHDIKLNPKSEIRITKEILNPIISTHLFFKKNGQIPSFFSYNNSISENDPEFGFFGNSENIDTDGLGFNESDEESLFSL